MGIGGKQFLISVMAYEATEQGAFTEQLLSSDVQPASKSICYAL